MEFLKGTFSKVRTFWFGLSRSVKIVSIIVLAIVLIILLSSGGDSEGTSIETVQKQPLSRTVLASGVVVSSTDLSLSFEASKMVESVRVRVGDKVIKGQILATEKSATERGVYNAARGALLAAEARYKKVLDGSSNEEIALAKVNLENTKKVQDGLVENARRKMLSDGLVAEPGSSDDVAGAPTVSGIYTGVEGEYRLTARTVNGRRIEYRGVESGEAQVSSVYAKPLGTKGLSLLFPDTTIFSEGDKWTINIPNTNSGTYTTNKNAYDAALVTREAEVSQAEAELTLKRATARPAEVDAALADIVSARAQLEQAAAALEKTILRAPSDGTITKVDVKVGEVPEAMKEVMVLQDIVNLYLEADINETNVPLLKIGQPVTVTLDAFGNAKTYQATISSIDPSATITDGIVNYQIKALLGTNDGIRPGMTANMNILAYEVQDALVLPGRAIEKRDNTYFVQFITDERREKTIDKEITIGMRGDGDMVEITGGLAEGDKVLWSTKK